MQALPPNFVRRRARRTSCTATVRTCARHRQFDQHSSSCWTVEVRPSHIDQCHNLSSTFTHGDLRQHCFQPVLRFRHPGQPSLKRSLLCEGRSSLLCSPQHFSTEARHHLHGPLHSDLNVECIVTAIWRPRESSHSEYSVRVPSLRLKSSPDVRCASPNRQSLLGDNHRL